jgi:DNA-binding IclR family transcriptional regulator
MPVDLVQEAKPVSDGARKPPNTEDALYVQSVEKAFRVLFAIGRSEAPIGLTQLAAASGLDRSAAQRFSHTLEKLGYLRKDPRKRRFALTPRALEIGAMYLHSATLVERGRPWLSKLCRRTGETVSLTVLDGTDVLYLLRRHADTVTRAQVTIGSRLPAFCSAPGISMLAALPRPSAMAVIEASERTAFTPRTVTEIPAVATRLDEAARHGYALVVEQVFAGKASIAVPVLGGASEPVAAVHVTFTLQGCSPEEAVPHFVPLLTEAAQGLARSLAGGGAA